MKRRSKFGNSEILVSNSIRKVISDVSTLLDLHCITPETALYAFLQSARSSLLSAFNHCDEIKHF